MDTIMIIKDFVQIRVYGYFAWKNETENVLLYDKPEGARIAKVQREAITVLDSTRDTARAEILGWVIKRALFEPTVPVMLETPQPLLSEIKVQKEIENGARTALPWALTGVSLVATGIVSVMLSSDWGEAASNYQRQIDVSEEADLSDSVLSPLREARDQAKSRQTKYGLVGYSCLIGGGVMLIAVLIKSERAPEKSASAVSFAPIITPDYWGASLVIHATR